MDVSQILPKLCVGSCPRSVDDIDRLAEEIKVSAVVNVQTDGDLDYWEIDWPTLASHYDRLGMDARRLPVQDFSPEALQENLPRCVDAVKELLTLGHKVFVHCNVGVNRSPSICIAYLHWVDGRTLDDAVGHVTRCRSCEPYVEAIRLASADRPVGSDD